MPQQRSSPLKSEFQRRARRVLLAQVAAAALILGGGAGALWYGLSQEGETAAPTPPVQNNIPQEQPLYVRALTDGEKALAKKFFGEALDVSSVNIQVFATQNDNAPTYVMPGERSNIRVHGARYAVPDYSRTDNAFLFGAIVHEFTRLWQNQAGKNWQHAKNTDYAYVLHSELSFGHYGPYQQAAIMEDYARRFFHETHQSNWMARQYGPNNCSADDFLMRVVENKFPAARQSREALEATYMRGPTVAETAVIYGIFGKEIDVGDMRVHASPRSCGWSQIASVNSPRDMFFWSAAYHSNDFAKDERSDSLGNFLHEATHIWQKQNDYRHTNWRQPNAWKMYHYPIDLKKWRFEDYGVEQQAAIIDDYARAYLHKESTSKWLPGTYADSRHNRELVRYLVETRFPEAAKTRAYFEKNGVLPTPSQPQPKIAEIPDKPEAQASGCSAQSEVKAGGVKIVTIRCG